MCMRDFAGGRGGRGGAGEGSRMRTGGLLAQRTAGNPPPPREPVEPPDADGTLHAARCDTAGMMVVFFPCVEDKRRERFDRRSCDCLCIYRQNTRPHVVDRALRR